MRTPACSYSTIEGADIQFDCFSDLKGIDKSDFLDTYRLSQEEARINAREL